MFQSNRLRNYVAGLGTGSFRMLFQVLVGLWLTPFILRYLDRQEFAIFTLTLEVLNWLTLLDIGITAGLRMQAARFNNHLEQEKTNRLASTAFFAQNVVVLAVLTGGCVLTFFFPHFFPIRPDLQHEAKIVMALCVLGVAVTVASQTFSALLIANQQQHVDNMIGVLLIVIRTVLIVLFIKLGFGLVSLAIAHVAARITTASLAWIRVRRLLPQLRIRFQSASWREFRQIGSVGLWLSLAGLAGLVIDSLSSVVTAKIISMEAVTALVLTGRFYELAGSLVWLLSETARPMLGQLLGENKMEKSLGVYRQIFALSTGLATIAAFSVWAGNGCFVPQWVGSINYAGKYVDLALAFSIIIHLWVLPNRVILSANLWVRQPCWVRIIEGFLNLGLAIWLGKLFGVIGIVSATVMASALTSLWLLPLFTARMFGRPFWKFLWDDAAPVVALITFIFPIAIVARSVATNISGFFGAALGALLTGLCGFGLLWGLIFNDAMRARFSIRSFLEQIGWGTRGTSSVPAPR